MQQRPLAPIPLATAILTALTALGYLFRLGLGLRYFPSWLIFLCLLGFGVYAFLAVVLFFRRRDMMLPIAAGALCLLDLISLMGSFASVWSFLGSILTLVAALCLLGAALCTTLPRFYPYAPWAEKLWFLPGLAAALGTFLSVAAYPSVGSLLAAPFSIALCFLLALTILFPEGLPGPVSAPPPAAPGAEYEGPADFGLLGEDDLPPEAPFASGEPWDGYCEMLKHVLLLLFTFGVWYLIWVYRTTAYLDRVEDAPWRTPTYQLLLCLFVPGYSIYWVYQSAKRLDRLALRQGVFSDLRVLCLVLAFFVPVLPAALMQDKMNQLSGRQAGRSPFASPAGDEALSARLRTYKDLLDDGLITQEDYDAKKAQILGL